MNLRPISVGFRTNALAMLVYLLHPHGLWSGTAFLWAYRMQPDGPDHPGFLTFPTP